MSDQNLALVQEGQARFNRGDLEGALELFAPEMEWDTTQAVPDGQIYRGRPAILEFCRSIRPHRRVRAPHRPSQRAAGGRPLGLTNLRRGPFREWCPQPTPKSSAA